MNTLIKNGKGIISTYKDDSWIIDANSGAIIIEDIIPHIGDSIAKGETIQTVLNNLFNDILPRIPIINYATMFKTDEHGIDLEHPEVTGLNGDAIYIRITFLNSETPLYISCWLLQSDIESLKTLINTKASKSEYEILRGEIEDKASLIQLNYLQEQINSKVDKSQVDKLQNIVDKKANIDQVAKLESIIFNKADKTQLVEISDTIDSIQSSLDSFIGSGDIGNFDQVIQELKTDISDKVSREDIQIIIPSIEEKADKSQLEEISKRIESIEEVNLDNLLVKLDSMALSISKLDKMINSVKTNIQRKADTSYVERIDTDLKRATTKLDTIVESKADKIDLISKANKSDVDALYNTNVVLTNHINQVKKDVTTKASQSDLDSKYDELIHAISDQHTVHRNDIRQINNNITSVEKDIDKIEESINNLSTFATHEWIQILTPEQYERIHPSRIDPAKLYMCVKYNKPYALYIGSILIAERNVDTSTGFVYTFPITF